MITYHKTLNGRIAKIDKYESDCWIRCTAPNEKDINYLMSEFNIDPVLLRASTDPEESSHVNVSGDNVLIVIDSPVVEKTAKNFIYYTNPLSIIITPDTVITVSLKENSIMEDFSNGFIRLARPEKRACFAFRAVLRIASRYLQYLKQIMKITEHVEKEIKKTMKNQDIVQLLEIKKSLVYLSSALKSINIMLEKVSRGKHIKLDEESSSLLSDVMVETRQAEEMSEIYLGILSTIMETFSSLITNNLNDVTKILTSVTLILSMPTMIAGIYGMNNPGIPTMEDWRMPFILMAVIMGITWIILKRKDMI